ncbi:FAD-binding oxidoreductase [Roseovarius aestuarii]|uniref:Putative FAD-linked oxidoreductase n=1 Tax=Roseovarius aestuarii TaxID=475083 RepID=A0A1X7BPY3_9RHOB|nr:FAD-binding oxidoreductase [Roseovarius aestuarii]SMC11651.1 putative FAD-linked oxidoreductase [Roseovarius aestuarii]
MTLSASDVADLAKLDLRLMRAEDLKGRDPGFDPGNFDAGIAVCPKSTADVVAIVACCAAKGISIVPHGGRTGLAGGAESSPGQLVVMMDKMNVIREIDAASCLAVVDAGVTLSQLEEEVGKHGLTVGIDLAARGSCTIGGMVATNAGGSEAFRNGVMRQRILGLEVVMPDGSVMSDLKRVIKANEGYDIKHLFIGSEGTLGIVTGVVLKLEAATGARKTILAAAPDASSALSFFQRLHHAYGTKLLTAEIMWRDYFQNTLKALNFERRFGNLVGEVLVIFEFDNIEDEDALLEILSQSLEAEEISDALLAKNEQERIDIWAVREETFLIDKMFPGGCWFDISIPLNKLDAFVRESSARLHALDPKLGIYVMGHLGDGNLHYSIAKDTPVNHRYTEISAALYQGLSEIGGSFSAEHGIGVEKREALAKFGDPAKLALMGAIKNAIDPQNIMNPGKLMCRQSAERDLV